MLLRSLTLSSTDIPSTSSVGMSTSEEPSSVMQISDDLEASEAGCTTNVGAKSVNSPESGLEQFLSHLSVMILKNRDVATLEDVYQIYLHKLESFPKETKLK